MHLQKSCIGLVCFIFLIFISAVFAAEDLKKQPIKVGIRISGHGKITENDRKIRQVLNNEIEKRAILSDDPLFELFISTEEIKKSDENEIILSVLTTIKLPDEVIELGKKNEIFYSIHSSKKKYKNLPKEGKYIREYVTEEYLKQFHDIYDHEIFIVPETKLEEQCKKIIDNFFEKYLPTKGESK